MLIRLLTSFIGIAVMIPIMWFSNTYLFPAAVAFMIVIGLYEIFSCLGFNKKLYITIPAYLIGAIMPFVSKYLEEFDIISPIICLVFFLYLLYLMFGAVLFHKSYDIKSIAIGYVFVIYIICGMTSIQMLRNLPYGLLTVIPVFLAAWITDIFAYFTGRFLGKHKLCETISPKKTVEGSIGGLIFCVSSFIVYSIIFFNIKSVSAFIFVALVGAVLSIVAQLGDLTMSLIKRQFGIKDFGKLFPGHGGVLDRFDSIIAVAPLLLMIILISQSVFINY